MLSSAEKHFRKTGSLAAALKRPHLYKWLVTKGYFPEAYVLPPCFEVKTYPSYGTVYARHTSTAFRPRVSEYLSVHFPKTDWTDRTFGIIDPEIHSDIATAITKNWRTVVRTLFKSKTRVYSYSFPVPVNSKTKGVIGGARSGRMIYEFIEMAEHDLASLAYRYRFLITTDVKNFYPSIYTHSIAWAIHGKKRIRAGRNRNNFSYFGNRIDRLFQSANDGCTNGIPIGPVVSDIIAEIVLSSVDRLFSKDLSSDVFVVRFKDDYRILARSEEDGRSAIKALQSALKEHHLELNDEKTEFHRLPSGLFRKWVSEYYAVNPRPKTYYRFGRFKEVYLSVVTIDRNNPGSGVIDRFLADLVTAKYRLRVKLDARTLPKIVSLLLKLGELRTKAFPKILAIIESILVSPFGRKYSDAIESYLLEYLDHLSKKESENKYLIAWIVYFLRANGFDGKLGSPKRFADPLVRSIRTSRFTHFSHCRDFVVFRGVKAASKRTSLLKHLDVFKPQ